MVKLTKGFVCVLTLLFFSTLNFAQTKATLTGNVTDSDDGSALPGANIILVGTTIGAASSGSGNFTVDNIPPGTYSVRVSYIGYETSETADVFFSAGEMKTLNFSLVLTGIEMNPISVSASRRPEKVLEAPASVAVLEAKSLQARPVLTATEHLKTIPGVDVATTGMNQSNVVVRGFNNIFSGALLVLVDNRIARVPGLRFNAYNFISSSNEDLEQIEVVLGPGAALYGPNAANGVFHMLTKSPFGSEGTTVTVGGGERDLRMISFRHAGSPSERFGYKISGQYYAATDWKFNDPAEPATITKFQQTPTGIVPQGGPIPNNRDFDIDKISVDARLEFRPSDDFTATFSGGLNRGNSIELTGIGAAQVIDWTYSFAQARFRYKDLFVQGYGNFSHSGDSFNLRSGSLTVDRSKFIVAQMQHSYTLSDKQRFTYGFDGVFTRPDTRATINGLNEDNDNFDEFGVYLQSDTELSSKLKFVAAGRIDKHSELEDPVLSPRAALVFKPTPKDNFRFTYNRAFSTPSALNLSLDLIGAPDVYGIGAAFAPAFGFAPSIDFRVQGVPRSGFNFRRDGSGNFMFRSPFAPLAGLSNSDFISLNDPLFTNVMWAVGRGAVSGGLATSLIGAGIPAATVLALIGQIEALVPTVSNVNNVMLTLNPATGTFLPDTPVDVPAIKESTTQTFELGYKGIVAEKFVVGIDAYHTRIENFVSPLLVVTPNVFLDPATLAASLGAQFGAGLAANPVLAATLAAILDNPAAGGNGNGSAVDELTTIYTSGAAQVPYGTVSPQEAFDPTAVLQTYRNFGEVDFFGLDVTLTYFVNSNWILNGNYSFVSEDLFENLDGIDDIALNAPQHKFGGSITYRNEKSGFDGNLRLRFVNSFPVATGVFGGRDAVTGQVAEVSSYSVLDFTANYDLPFSPNTSVGLTIQNLTDNKHQELLGAPEIGRLSIVRLTQSF